MGNLIQQSDVRELLKDPAMVEEMISKTAERLANDPDAADDMAEDVAEEMSEYLQNNPEFKKKILSAAIKDQAFKEKVLRELIEEFM